MDDIINQITINIQQARYESLIIDIAKAYDGYQFYLPAFLDFRGRIYRVGILHFHERDLVRSLIVFATNDKLENPLDEYEKKYYNSIASHYMSQKSFQSALDTINIIYNAMDKISMKDFICQLCDAKNPFQTFALIFGLYHSRPYFYQVSGISEIQDAKELEEYYYYMLRNTPITQDASASAYQIMSWLLLDEDLAIKTNLFPAAEKSDIYEFLRVELLESLSKDENIDESLLKYLQEGLTRKIVKMIFMPLIYGKTLISTIRDLKKNLGSLITQKECVTVSKHCFSFWQKKYYNMYNLILLIRSIGWFVSSMNLPVKYKQAYYLTLQDYVKMDNIKIWIYDRLKKKRRQVTLRLASSNRDHRKSEISTFVNFIHQKDAQVAMTVVKYMREDFQDRSPPLYTVHDNFISTTKYCSSIADIYINTFINSLGDPLSIINEFIYTNLVYPYQEGEVSYEKIISRNYLEVILNRSIQHNKEKLSKAEVKKLSSKVQHILELYGKYIEHVACPRHNNYDIAIPLEERYNIYKSKYNQFISKMKPKYKVKNLFNYSVFY